MKLPEETLRQIGEYIPAVIWAERECSADPSAREALSQWIDERPYIKREFFPGLDPTYRHPRYPIGDPWDVLDWTEKVVVDAVVRAQSQKSWRQFKEDLGKVRAEVAVLEKSISRFRQYASSAESEFQYLFMMPSAELHFELRFRELMRRVARALGFFPDGGVPFRLRPASPDVVHRVSSGMEEFDQDFLDALNLVATRTRAASTRLEVAVKAVAQPARPKQDHFLRDLAEIWSVHTSKKPTVSQNGGNVTGDFATFCWLSHALLPADKKKFAPMSDDRIVEATRAIGKSRRR